MAQASLWSLLGFVLWTITVLVIGIGTPRVHAILTRRAAPKSFLADAPHGSDRYRRTMRAHMNCVENLPLYASLVLMARLIELQSQPFQLLAAAVLPARIAQSVIHIASGTNRAVVARFCFFCVQLACMACMAYLIAGKL
jgi:uncharacterized MAPEG superfamily protein